MKFIGAMFTLTAGLAIVVSAAEAPAPTVFKFSGDVQYRLRLNWVQKQDAASNKISTGDYQNVYMWNLKMTAQPAEDLLIGVRLSNPLGANCEVVSTNMATVTKPNGSNLLSVPEFSLKWTHTVHTLSAGILPVSGSTVLDLMAYESDSLTIGQKNYANFETTMNSSQKGVNLGISPLKSDAISISADLLVALASDSDASQVADQFKKDQWRFFLKAPISLQKGTYMVQSAAVLRTNVVRNSSLSKSNVSCIGGLDLFAKPVKDLTLKAGAAFGGYNTNALKEDAPTAVIGPRGLISGAGAAYASPVGTISLDYAYCFSKEMIKAPGVDYFQNYLDCKYTYSIKKFSIAPRLRWWHLSNSATSVSTTTVRPELIFKAAF